jgi:hypothetical protein
LIKLIDISDIQAMKPVSSNANEAKKIDPFILEAQQFDLKELLGSALYLDFLKDFSASPALQKYSDLFYGSEFECGGIAYKHEGLKSVFVYLSYARYVLNSNIEATAFGTVHKKEEYSEHVDDSTVRKLYDQSYSGALAYWSDVERFLDSKKYDLWKCKSSGKIKKVRIGGVGDGACERRGRQ